MTRGEILSDCGVDIIIPNDLPFLSGIEVRGKRTLMIRNIRNKLRAQIHQSGDDVDEEEVGFLSPSSVGLGNVTERGYIDQQLRQLP